ncbi:rCG20860 [Rattus norvegicus]|uniref:RCG20860 n=1 Tax=Rattus norvegicus TaxID=10116 RepID=A6JED0_RAT|nr:rCG20860 [Rattus norvegicus]
MTMKAGYQLLSQRHTGLPTDRRRSISQGSPPPQLSQTSRRLKCSPGLISFLVLFLAAHCCSKAQVCTVEAAPCTESQCRLHRDAKE